MNHKQSDLVRQLALDGLLTALLVVLGMIKLPSLFPGAEFQLSAPYAVCLASTVGFGRYLGIGICSSLIQLLLGTHTIWNVMVAMVFRVVAGSIAAYCPWKRTALVISGPLGTASARLVLAAMLSTPALPLLTAALPGMVFTGICALLMEPLLRRAIYTAYPARSGLD